MDNRAVDVVGQRRLTGRMNGYARVETAIREAPEGKTLDGFAGSHVPQDHHIIKGARQRPLPVRRQTNGSDLAGMAAEAQDGLAGFQIPQEKRTVVARR